MSHWSILSVSLLTIGLAVSPVWAQAANPAAPPEGTTQQAVAAPSPVDAIRQAADPSAAVAAYGRAVSEAGGRPNQAILEAYVHRMVEFDMPEAAYHQARMLVDVDPDDAVGWAVMSFVAGRRGQMAEALADAVQAGLREPDNRFVQEVAGQLLAWYDLNKPTVSNSLAESLERVRRQLASKAAFADAYVDAAEQLKPGVGERRGGAQTQPAPSVQAPVEQREYSTQPWPEPVYTYQQPSLMSDSYSTWYPAYPQDFYYPSLVYSAPYVAPDWWWWSSWWPFGFGHGHDVVDIDIDNVFVDGDLWRLKAFNKDLTFLRLGDKFHLVGFDHSGFSRQFGADRRLAGARTSDVTRSLARQGVTREAGRLAARDVSRATGSSRIFGPGREAGRLSFGSRDGRAGAVRGRGEQVTRGAGPAQTGRLSGRDIDLRGGRDVSRGPALGSSRGMAPADALRPQRVEPQRGGLTRSVDRPMGVTAPQPQRLPGYGLGGTSGLRSGGSRAGSRDVLRPQAVSPRTQSPSRGFQSPSVGSPSRSGFRGPSGGSSIGSRSSMGSPSRMSSPSRNISRSGSSMGAGRAPVSRGAAPAGRSGGGGGGGRGGGGGGGRR